MRSKEIKRAIDALGPWTQRYEMEGQFTTNLKISGEPVWEELRRVFYEDLKDVRILEVESNAGYYSIMLSKEGANVTAVESTRKYYLQSKWTQYFFEQLDNKKYPVNFINKSIDKLKFKKMGWFEYVFSDSNLGVSETNKENQRYYIGKLCDITDKIILRIDKELIGYFNSLFLEHEFYMLKRYNGKKFIVLYGRLIKEENGWDPIQ